MSSHTLKIRKVDKPVFDSIVKGEKVIETRAATPRYRKIKAGDILTFVYQGERLEKEIKNVKVYKGIDEMLEELDFKQVMPFVGSVEEMKIIYYSFPKYKDKIKKHGLIAWWMK